MAEGKVVQVRGPVVDVRFPADALPPLLQALRITDEKKAINLVVEVAQHLGDDTVRCVAMDSTDGLVRGMPVTDTGSQIKVPVGPATLGRLFDLLGNPIDERGPVENEDYVGVLARTDGGVLCTLESSRVSVGPRAEYIVEIYGTGGSVRWNFESLNHVDVCIGRGEGPVQGYTRVMAGPGMPDFDRFQPGAGTSMGFDDLKTIEAFHFLKSIVDGAQIEPGFGAAYTAARTNQARIRSWESGSWESVSA